MPSDISGIQGFDATKYADLVESARTEYVSKDKVDQLLLEANAKGLNFDEAAASVTKQLPTLPPPLTSTDHWNNNLAGMPSMGANYLALISELSAEQRKESAEQRNLQTEQIVSELKEQASTIRDKAVTQLCLGIASGALSIAQGAISGSMMAKGLSANNKLDGVARQNADMMLNTNVQSFNSAMGGVTGMMGSITNSAGSFFDADLKESDAKIERMRATNDALDSLEQSLKELSQKAISTMDTIQQNMNQTRTKILT